MALTEEEQIEILAQEHALEIVDRLKTAFKKQFGEELSDSFIIDQIDIKIEESKTSLVQHMLRQVCATVLEPANYFRAKKMLIERNKPVIQPSESADVQPKRGRATRSK